ncbi:MAG: hypothetical protein Q4G03_11405 [Planctomycetia bacterium]|nr:hypothetical protein [Planctomycetia bacterium]
MNERYQEHVALWRYVDDCYAGAQRVKFGPNALEYLPIQPLEREELNTRGVQFDHSRYAFRRKIATYENFFRPIIDDVVGLMQRNPATVRFGMTCDEESAPEVVKLKDWGNAFNDGLAGLKNRLNFAQILYGRYGMLLDVQTDRAGLNPSFKIVEYDPRKILDGQVEHERANQFDALRWVLLDESTKLFDPDQKTWRFHPKWRLLALDRRGMYYVAIFQGDAIQEQWRNFELLRPDKRMAVYPNFKGKILDFIPFTVCNVERLGVQNWSRPPYLDVARLAIENYVVDSWYKMGLYFHATPTLAVCNATRESNDVRLGGVVWPKSSGGAPVTVSILETSGRGLAELRNAKEELKSVLRYTSIRDLLEHAGANSSSDSLRIRTTAGTVSVAAIDRTGARAIEEQLCFASIWSGATVEQTRQRISYQPDVTYLGAEFQMDAAVELLKTNYETRALSNRSAYAFLERAAPGVLPSYDDNVRQIQEERGALQPNGERSTPKTQESDDITPLTNQKEEK